MGREGLLVLRGRTWADTFTCFYFSEILCTSAVARSGAGHCFFSINCWDTFSARGIQKDYSGLRLQPAGGLGAQRSTYNGLGRIHTAGSKFLCRNGRGVSRIKDSKPC